VDLAVGTRVAGLVEGFDNDFGTYAEQLVVQAAGLAVVPDGLDLVAASTVPLNGQTAAQIVDLLGDPRTGSDRLLVTGAAGAVGAYVASLAQDRGWRVTGLARAEDEEFVRGLGADFTSRAEPGWDAVADGGVLQEQGLALVGDGGIFVGVQPSAQLPPERGITVHTVLVQSNAEQLGALLARTASGELPARVHATLPLDEVADAHRAVAKGGVRGRYVLLP
jgi:NADPH:quinone reductase-like Zn-dependent oxidoreductase